MSYGFPAEFPNPWVILLHASVIFLVLDVCKIFLAFQWKLTYLLCFGYLSAPQAKNFDLFGAPLSFFLHFETISRHFIQNVRKFLQISGISDLDICKIFLVFKKNFTYVCKKKHWWEASFMKAHKSYREHPTMRNAVK